MEDFGVFSSRRARRLAALLRQAISEELARMADPSLQDAVVTGVDVGVDLDLATVYFFVRGGADAVAAAQTALERSQGRLRTSLAHQVRMKRVPKLRFKVDEGIVRGISVEERLAEIARVSTSNNAVVSHSDLQREAGVVAEASVSPEDGFTVKRGRFQ